MGMIQLRRRPCLPYKLRDKSGRQKATADGFCIFCRHVGPACGLQTRRGLKCTRIRGHRGECVSCDLSGAEHDCARRDNRHHPDPRWRAY